MTTDPTALALPASLRVRVTNRDIIDGESRSCSSCALALAINRALPGDWCCEVVPYAAFVEADGIRFYREKYGPWWGAQRLPVKHLPEGLIEWAMEFDDWKEYRQLGAKAWKEENGGDDRPLRPEPWEFDLDLTKLIKGDADA